MKPAGLFGLLGLLAVGVLPADDQAPRTAAPPAPDLPVIRISVDLIQVDAVVTDRSGRHVTDLLPEDFEIHEGGRRKRITNVTYVRGESHLPAASAGGVVPSARAPRTLVFVVDDLGLSAHGMSRTRRLLVDYAATRFGSGDRATLLRTSDEDGALSLSPDPQALRVAAEALRYNLWSRAGLQPALAMSPESRFASADAFQRQWVATQSLAALKGAVDALRAVPGRKALILVSEGFPLLEGTESDRLSRDTRGRLDGLYGDTGILAAIRSLTDHANRASVVVYALDPRGLMIDLPSAADSVSGTSAGSGSSANPAIRLMQDRRARRFDSHASLNAVTEPTGGLAVYERNDLARGLEDILVDTSGYYLIGYEPEASTFAAKDGQPRFHSLKLKVRRSGLRVRTRAGFYGVTDETVAKAAPPAIP